MLALSALLMARRAPLPSYTGTWSLTTTSVNQSGELLDESAAYPLLTATVKRDDLTFTFVDHDFSDLLFQKLEVRGLSLSTPTFTASGTKAGKLSGKLKFDRSTPLPRTAVGELNGRAYTITIASETEFEVAWQTAPDDPSLTVIRAVKIVTVHTWLRLFFVWSVVIALTAVAMHALFSPPAEPEEEKQKAD
jgi:hypothetical protein